MSRGAPEPSDLLFKVRVLPATPITDATLTPEDGPDPAAPFKGPYRRYAADFAALGSQLRMSLQPDGARTAALEFRIFVYDNDGKLLNAVGRTVDMHLDPKQYASIVRTGFGMRLQFSAPARGESFLRLAIHDLRSNKWGVVEVPASTVARLPALSPDTSAAATQRSADTPPAAGPK